MVRVLTAGSGANHAVHVRATHAQLNLVISPRISDVVLAKILVTDHLTGKTPRCKSRRPPGWSDRICTFESVAGRRPKAGGSFSVSVLPCRT